LRSPSGADAGGWAQRAKRAGPGGRFIADRSPAPGGRFCRSGHRV